MAPPSRGQAVLDSAATGTQLSSSHEALHTILKTKPLEDTAQVTSARLKRKNESPTISSDLPSPTVSKRAKRSITRRDVTALLIEQEQMARTARPEGWVVTRRPVPATVESTTGNNNED